MKTSLLGVATLAMCAGGAWAAVEVAGQGNYDAMDCMGGPITSIALSDSHVAGMYDVTGTLVGKPGMLYHMTSIRCLGAWSIIDGKYGDSGNCVIVDLDGDKMIGRYAQPHGSGEGTWTVIAGTGKYSRVSSEGVYRAIGQFPQPYAGNTQLCSRVTGTWKLR